MFLHIILLSIKTSQKEKYNLLTQFQYVNKELD